MEIKEGARYDLLIMGGTVLDGSGNLAAKADIGILNDRIAAVGDLTGNEATTVITAEGFHVAPGFIDIHTHSDVSALYNPGQSSAIAMGVTTQVVGNCGLSIGLANRAEIFEFERRWIAPHGGRITWETFDEHLEMISDRGVATNLIPLVGHGTLRKRLIGMEERPADSADLAAMRRELAAALDAGAWGLSSGLEYTPSSYADVDELANLCEVVREYGGLYATHLRNEGDLLVEAVLEALKVAERAGVPLQLSHHKAEGRQNWGRVTETLGMVNLARSRGMDVQLDQYPYTAFMTALAVQILPHQAQSGSYEEVASRLQDPSQRALIREQIQAAHPDWDDLSAVSPWSNMQIGVCRGRPEIQGRTLADLAGEAGKNPIDFSLDLLTETGGYVSAVNFAIGEEDIARVMRYPFTSIGSDGVGAHPWGTIGKDRVHPRAYGTFARVLGRYVREMGVLSEADAIHKMTGLPAARLGIVDRGQIRPEYFADIVIYDPERIGDRATFEEPHRYAAGIEAVVVNGRIAMHSGEPNGELFGRVLRKTD